MLTTYSAREFTGHQPSVTKLPPRSNSTKYEFTQLCVGPTLCRVDRLLNLYVVMKLADPCPSLVARFLKQRR